MTNSRKSLGRNLSALLSPGSALFVEPAASLKLDIQQLQPGKYQPRREMNPDSLKELAESIKKQGVLQPLLVRELDRARYEIIAGERRWRASQLAGLSEVPVIIKQVDDETAMAMALIENLQREDLNAMDQANAMHRLTSEFDLTHQQVADLLSKSRTAVSNFLRLMSLAPPVKLLLEQGALDMGHARALLALEPEEQHETAQTLIRKNLSVRETERLVEQLKTKKDRPKYLKRKPDVKTSTQINQLAKQLKAPIKIKSGAKGNGQLIIYYESDSLLQQILNKMLTSM